MENPVARCHLLFFHAVFLGNFLISSSRRQHGVCSRGFPSRFGQQLPWNGCNKCWLGIVLLFVCCFNSLFSGICLGRCWVILEERWEEYRGKSRNPYPSIASRAVAPWMSYVVSFCIDFSLFGASTVFLLISAQIIGNMSRSTGLWSCHWVLILAALLWPLMWFGTPEDFWPAAVFALATTTLASLLLLVGILMDSTVVHDGGSSKSFDLESCALSFAIMLFAFGGVSAFPTFQNDMENRQKFPRSACLAFVILMLLYTPVAVSGYSVYGSAANENVLLSLRSVGNAFIVVIELLMACHLFFAFLLVINAPAQEIEEILRIPKSELGLPLI